MVVLKKQEMGNLKQKELELFSTAKIFNSGINSNLDEYNKFYNNSFSKIKKVNACYIHLLFRHIKFNS